MNTATPTALLLSQLSTAEMQALASPVSLSSPQDIMPSQSRSPISPTSPQTTSPTPSTFGNLIFTIFFIFITTTHHSSLPTTRIRISISNLPNLTIPHYHPHINPNQTSRSLRISSSHRSSTIILSI